MPDMNVSVVIPTKNRLTDLLITIKSIIKQSRLPDEMIIVDQNSSSDIKDKVLSDLDSLDNSIREKICVKYIHDPSITGLTQARNRAIDTNSCEILLFLDDDVILEDDFILSVMEVFDKNHDISGVSGVITNSNRGLIGDILYKIFMKGPFTDKRYLINTHPAYKQKEIVNVAILPGGLTAYRKEVFNDFRFDENFIAYGLSEDFDFSYRVSRKYNNAITTKARLIHVASDTGRSDVRKHRESWILSMQYFFRKNVDKNLFNYLCYYWFIIGNILFGILLALFKNKNDVLIGYIRGLRKAFSGSKSDYLRSNKK